mmetsp:Transcript_13006/g.14973  ORF Transcript_13006/g.14973 Transcript_13006/m.14973 type:complete len:141 (+) Transcript_13006:995-1417(+)
MWGFEEITSDTEKVIQDATENPNNYVLKTQREGGGNNYYGNDIPPILVNKEELVNYSLMRRIRPIEFDSFVCKNRKVYKGKCISEIGIFGVILVKVNPDTELREILLNKDTGFLLRTKGANTNEGGVYGGFSFIDHVYLE